MADAISGFPIANFDASTLKTDALRLQIISNYHIFNTLSSIYSNWPSAKILIIANLLPLVGVLVPGWSPQQLILVYWLENLVIGLVHVLKIITWRPRVDESDLEDFIAPNLTGEEREAALDKVEERLEWFGALGGAKFERVFKKLLMIPAFVVSYFGICLIHAYFFWFHSPGYSISGSSGFFDWLVNHHGLLDIGIIVAVISLAYSHLLSFHRHYIKANEYKRTTENVLMVKPFGRIAIQHFVISFGLIAVVGLGSPMMPIIVLVFAKTAIDLRNHLRELAGRKVEQQPTSLYRMLQAR